MLWILYVSTRDLLSCGDASSGFSNQPSARDMNTIGIRTRALRNSLRSCKTLEDM